MYPAGGAIAIHNLQQFTSTLGRRGVRAIVITDACRAGRLVGTAEGAARTTAALLSDWTHTTRLVSSQAQQFSREGPQWGGGHGVFTYFLVDGLLGTANRDGDRAITSLEVKRYLLDVVPRATGDQQVPEVLGETSAPLAAHDPASRQLVLGPSRDPGAMPVFAAGRAETSTARLDAAQRVVNAYIQGGNNLPSAAEFREAARAIAALLGTLDRRDSRARSLAAMRTFLEGYAWVRQGKPAYAIPILRRSLALERTPHAMNGLAAAYVNGGQPDSAQTLLLAVIRQMPRWAYPFNSLGALYHRQARYDEAIRMFERAIAADSTYGKAYANLGTTFLTVGRHEEATRAWNRAVELDPENSADLIARFLYSQRKDLVRADSVYERALALAPGSLLTMVRKGDQQKAAGNLDAAEREYRRALAVDSGYALAFSGLGTVYEARFDQAADSALLDSAAAAFQKARSLAPNDPVFARNAGIIGARLGRLTFADSALREAVRLDSLDAASHSALAWLLGVREIGREAVVSHETAIRLDPANVNLYLALAGQHQTDSMFAAAERVYRRALTVAPGAAAAVVYRALGSLYEQWNKVPAAIRSYRRALELDPKSIEAAEALKTLETAKPSIAKPEGTPAETPTSP
jgi:tetratricopeptide (TPR) repeat protein